MWNVRPRVDEDPKPIIFESDSIIVIALETVVQSGKPLIWEKIVTNENLMLHNLMRLSSGVSSMVLFF